MNEGLAVVAEGAQLCFGNEKSPNRFDPTVKCGDFITVPVGVGHRLLDDRGLDSFGMVDSYPHNKE